MLFLIAGPSGSGKDTLINYACNRLPINRVKRFITRPVNPFEDFVSVSREEFEGLDLLFKWSAHGKLYGVPVIDFINNHFIVNVSRSIISEVKSLFPNQVVVIGLTAKSDVLRQRLINRGRDPLSEVVQRLNRSLKFNPDIVIDTSSSDVSVAGDELIRFLSKFF